MPTQKRHQAYFSILQQVEWRSRQFKPAACARAESVTSAWQNLPAFTLHCGPDANHARHFVAWKAAGRRMDDRERGYAV